MAYCFSSTPQPDAPSELTLEAIDALLAAVVEDQDEEAWKLVDRIDMVREQLREGVPADVILLRLSGPPVPPLQELTPEESRTLADKAISSYEKEFGKPGDPGYDEMVKNLNGLFEQVAVEGAAQRPAALAELQELSKRLDLSQHRISYTITAVDHETGEKVFHLDGTSYGERPGNIQCDLHTGDGDSSLIQRIQFDLRAETLTPKLVVKYIPAHKVPLQRP